ncbi:prolyl 4-hydroxylase subunit alpha-2 isoform X11 [Acanthochromis polyacanthus]|uniref:prolyl 4-hydroxylase subunit alpha-2 isoform X8 n=1 Tax=Acanthochromis polyacanthus TaxID=80966 RepID=UPI0022342E55|nr:prolyl 4-hydroxylase subunit alpha-2 isoform X8 [Acanthochromis polyacanthus]XP_051793462.1 prolyl 4-hydroxylase subunit alpha-2 isoform X9 [Acanthochromis polyacanthus]XP_051793463.1 prolyl 4-hydroxylase subunit alpha-2 isoform X10 [Acanthochromis polyacanthus]XP_051793464.1 prolyl 4-hydroxylase subunit alpha-2 isoform X11 [Acanthochromis polyacanthus]
MTVPTGYGPSKEFGSRWNRLLFDGDEKNYELWETKFLAHLRLLDLKTTILGGAPAAGSDGVAADANKNEEAYAVLIQLLDDKSLSLVMRDAADDGRKALQILRDHYAGKGKPRVISLYTELTSLQKGMNESVTDYIIRAETAITALRNAGETLSDGLLTAMILKGLPDVFKPFSVHITQSDSTLSFADFKTKLRSYESTEKCGASGSGEDSVMKVKGRDRRDNWSAKLTCFTCGLKGHKAAECTSIGERRDQRQWCSLCKSATHKDANCRRRKRDKVKQAVDEEDHTFAFKVQLDAAAPVNAERMRGLMVDSGATRHIITDMEKFEEFDPNFQAQSHILELADGERASGIALKKGTAKVRMRDNKGRDVDLMLKEALYVPSFSQDIFSVKAATAQGATVIFKEGQNRLIHKNDSTHQRAGGNLRYFEKLLFKQLQELNQSYQPASEEPILLGTYNRPPDHLPEREAYEALCRGEGLQMTEARRSRLFCRYHDGRRNPRLLLRPLKEEDEWDSPHIVRYLGILSDEEIGKIKELAKPRLARATVRDPKTGVLTTANYRVSKSAWLEGEDDPVIERVNQRIEDITGLTVDTAELLQVANYGVGGQYEPHYDFSRRPFDSNLKVDGNRLATFLNYMSDVEAGGATVFPDFGAAIWPRKGTAVFWYNLFRSGEGDYRTRHAACPVLVGSKWVSNKWIHERGQEFRRPCGLTEVD